MLHTCRKVSYMSCFELHSEKIKMIAASAVNEVLLDTSLTDRYLLTRVRADNCPTKYSCSYYNCIGSFTCPKDFSCTTFGGTLG